MTKSRIALLAIATLVLAGSTLAAPAAFAASSAHTSIVRNAKAQLRGTAHFAAPPACTWKSHDDVEDPFVDLLLG
jgi:hypothetical protein